LRLNNRALQIANEDNFPGNNKFISINSVINFALLAGIKSAINGQTKSFGALVEGMVLNVAAKAAPVLKINMTVIANPYFIEFMLVAEEHKILT